MSNKDSTDQLNSLIASGLAQHLAFAVVYGEITEEHANYKQSCNDRAHTIQKMQPNAWPPLDVKWDTRAENFYLALDGENITNFAKEYPNIEVCSVDTMELHNNLLLGAQRILEPFAEPYKQKTALLIAHLEFGGTVTPPMIRANENGLFFEGGNHRYGWARYRQQKKVPVLVLSKEISTIRSTISSLSTWS